MALRFQYTLLLVAALVQSSLAQSKEIAITGARIEVGDGRVIANGTILIRDGKIAEVGENVTVPSGAEVVDAKGRTVFPGFIDAYTTRGLKLPDAPASGTPPDSRTTAPASMWHENRKGIRTDISAAKCLDLKNVLKDNYAQGITTALVSSGSGSIRGIAAIVNYTADGSVQVPAAAAELSFRGTGGGPRGGGAPPPGGQPQGQPNPNAGTGYPGTLFGTTALLRQVLADAQFYANDSDAKKDDVYESLKPLVTHQMPAIFAVDTAREIARAGNVANEFGLKFMIGGGREAYRSADFLKAKGVPVLVTLDLGIEPSKTVEPGTDTRPKAVVDERYAQWKERSENVKRLNAAGVAIAFSTIGAGADDYLKNVRRIIGSGLPREAALRAMTSGAARILGIDDRAGTIEAGKQANLVIMTGDFADDKSEVESVFVEGTKVDVKKEASK